MAYVNVYPQRINWENEPSINTPINDVNLNKIDYAVYEHDRTLANWDTTKANQSDLLLSVKTIEYDDETGVFVFTWQNGTTKTVDLNIEKIPVSFSMNAQGVITMTTDDGTQYTADVGALIKTYTFTDSTEIDFTVTTDQSGNKTITAGIVDGSITGNKLQPNYLADCTAAKTAAENAETGAEDSAEDAEAWAVGERGGVPVDPTDPTYHNNSKYWSEQANVTTLSALTDTDIDNPADGQVLTYDGATSKWENKTPAAGGGSKITITTSELSLIGTTATLTDGVTTLNADFDNSGKAVFEGVTMTGTLTVTATNGVDTATKQITIQYYGNYTFVIAFFSATITITFPYTEGGTCTISDGDTTLTATESPMAFTIPNTGTWVATCTLDGQSKTQSFVITTEGQTESHTFEYGTINLTFANEFRGLTLTCSSGGTTISKVAPSTGNTMAFYPPSTGEWTITGIYSGVPYTANATITSLSTPESALLQLLPDGKTVTPTDDIQKWLLCAGITNKTSYTTLADVLGDSTTLLALISDSNAVDYMVRSTTWASGVCTDSTAMTDIGANDYCAETLLDDSTWCNAICNSTYFESVLSVKVPTMTDNTHPSGECIKSTIIGGSYDAYMAFDNNNNTYWCSGTSDGDAYVGYDYKTSVRVSKVVIKTTSNYDSNFGNIVVEGYDGAQWVAIATDTVVLLKNSTREIIVVPTSNYTKYRIHDTTGRVAEHMIATLQFYGR